MVDFVSAMGFSDQAGSFKDQVSSLSFPLFVLAVHLSCDPQEIDGLSFLLLTRADILSRLSLRVGPALKLYQRVRKLQDLVIDSWMA